MTTMRRIIQSSLLAAFGLTLLIGFSASRAYAGDPPWPTGLPWPTTVSWPTASPLLLGVPWSPSGQASYPPVSAPVVQPANTPIPPVIVSLPSNPPPVAPKSVQNNPLPTVVPPPSNPAPIVVPPTSVPAVNNPLPVIVAPTAAPIVNVPSLASNTNRGNAGSSRADALSADGAWRSLDSGASAWYLIGTGGEHMSVWLDSNPHSGMDMAVYSPDGGGSLVGHGTPDNANPDRLLWSGGHWSASGNWYALITNRNSVAVQYAVTDSGHQMGEKSCHSYWENIGTSRVFWTVCD